MIIQNMDPTACACDGRCIPFSFLYGTSLREGRRLRRRVVKVKYDHVLPHVNDLAPSSSLELGGKYPTHGPSLIIIV